MDIGILTYEGGWLGGKFLVDGKILKKLELVNFKANNYKVIEKVVRGYDYDHGHCYEYEFTDRMINHEDVGEISLKNILDRGIKVFALEYETF